MMWNNLWQLILVTFLPFLELRASIPYGILKLNMPWFEVYFICMLINVLLAPIVYYMLHWFVDIVIKIPFMGRLYDKIVLRTQRRIHDKVEKYGEWGLALFIGVPLPGSGVYTGALAAFLLGVPPRKFMIAVIWGVLIAGTAVLIVTLTGIESLQFFLKKV